MTAARVSFHILAMNGGLLTHRRSLVEQTAGSGKTGIPRDSSGRRPQRVQKPFAAAKDSNHASSHK
jgi:hypothetical protein